MSGYYDSAATVEAASGRSCGQYAGLLSACMARVEVFKGYLKLGEVAAGDH